MSASYDYVTDDRSLIVGDYQTAANSRLLKQLNVTHIVACGFDRPATVDVDANITYLYLPDLDDEPSANILRYLPRSVAFIRRAIQNRFGMNESKSDSRNGNGNGFLDSSLDGQKHSFSPSRQATSGCVLLHCTYGQSRSCSVCIAYLMAHRLSLLSSDTVENVRLFSDRLLHECYNFLIKRRKTMAINPGFMRQLEIYRRMLIARFWNKEDDSVFLIKSRAHAYYRASRAKVSTSFTFFHSPFDLRDLPSGEKIFRCRKCRVELFLQCNIIEEFKEDQIKKLPRSDIWRESTSGQSFKHGSMWSSSVAKRLEDPYISYGSDNSIYQIEPIEWARSQLELSLLSHDRRICCPKCITKLGHFDRHAKSFYFCIEIVASKVD